MKTLSPRSQRECTHGRYSTRLQLGGYVADIVPDQRESTSIHHCIVQRVGSSKVIHLGQEASFSAALECGHHYLEELAMAHREKLPGAIYGSTSVET